MGFEYGNARIASMRSRLLEPDTIARLGESANPSAMVAQLERSDDWAAILRQVAPLGTDATAALEAAIEFHRSARWSALPHFYEGQERGLVEALVMPLDLERALAVLRRRRAGEPADVIASTVVPGALLDAHSLALMARASGPAAMLRPLVDRGLLERGDAEHIAAAEVRGTRSAELEALLQEAVDRSRWTRSSGRGDEAAAVRRLLEHERADRDAVVVELTEAGPTLATILDRSMRLARLDAMTALARRDLLGIGAVAGYVAAVEAQAIRLRAMVARVRAHWTAEDAAPYLARTERPAWLAS
jgi:vacuolar-type H+-ATPase subunit C/Vma6